MNKLWMLWTALALAVGGCAAKPAINSFTADKTIIEIGNPVTLQWRVIDATSISISGVGGIPVNSAFITLYPEQTTTYILTATNGGGTTTSNAVTVTVNPRLDVSGGTYASAGSLGRTFAMVIRELTDTPPAAATTVTITPASGAAAFTLTCPGGKAMCLVFEPTVAPTAGSYTATASVGGASVSHTFQVDPAQRMYAAGPVFAAQTSSTTVSASWGPSPGAVAYRVKLVNGAGAAVGPEQTVTTTSATLTASAALNGTEQVAIETFAVDPSGDTATAEAPPPPNVSSVEADLAGEPGRWVMVPPETFAGNNLTVSIPSLALGEHAAVLILNVEGDDYLPSSPRNNVQLSVTGTSSLPVRDSGPIWEKPGMGLDPVLELERSGRVAHERWRALDEARVSAALAAGKGVRAPPVPGPITSTASFCVRVGLTSNFSRRPATLRHEAAHVAFYVDNADLDDFSLHEPGIWNSLASSWEGASNDGIYAKITGAFGPESDVDQNGKLIVLFSDQLGASQNGGILLGYFSSGDTLIDQADETANCSGSTGNRADMFIMNGIRNLTDAGSASSEVINRIYPDTLAHEFQHLINTNAHCLLNDCSQLEETWLNEGLSMVAEDVAGFGWNTDRAAGKLYLDRLPGPDIFSYNRRSLTTWEGDPIGNYQAVHSLVRYWADRYGQGILDDLVTGSLRGSERTESVLLSPFSRQLAEWTTALMFSNEPFSPSPVFDYQGSAWATPFHSDVAYVNYLPLNPGAAVNGQVRRNGWNAFLTGSGTGANATITITSTETIKPHVVVVRLDGSMPQCPGLLSSTVAGRCP